MRCPICQGKMTATAVDRYSTTWKCNNRHCGKVEMEYRGV